MASCGNHPGSERAFSNIDNDHNAQCKPESLGAKRIGSARVTASALTDIHVAESAHHHAARHRTYHVGEAALLISSSIISLPDYRNKASALGLSIVNSKRPGCGVNAARSIHSGPQVHTQRRTRLGHMAGMNPRNVVRRICWRVSIAPAGLFAWATSTRYMVSGFMFFTAVPSAPVWPGWRLCPVWNPPSPILPSRVSREHRVQAQEIRDPFYPGRNTAAFDGISDRSSAMPNTRVGGINSSRHRCLNFIAASTTLQSAASAATMASSPSPAVALRLSTTLTSRLPGGLQPAALPW